MKVKPNLQLQHGLNDTVEYTPDTFFNDLVIDEEVFDPTHIEVNVENKHFDKKQEEEKEKKV